LRMGKTTETQISITLNEIYFIHSLVVQHLDVLTAKNKDSMLILIAKDLGPAPAQLPRQDNSNVDLVLISRNKEAEFETKDSSNPEQIYTETKHLLFTIIKALPSLSEEADIKGVLVAAQKHAREKNDASLGEKIKKIVQNCRKLVDAGIITEQDNFSKLRKDLVEELINYEGQIKKNKPRNCKIKRSSKQYSRTQQILGTTI